MVTLLIMSVGLFSAGLMSTRSVSMTNHAMLHSQAVQLAQDVIDRVRVNASGLTHYSTMYADSPTATSKCIAVKCSAANLAAADLSDWKQKLANALPQGQGQVEINGNSILVSVRWRVRGVDRTYQLRAVDT